MALVASAPYPVQFDVDYPEKQSRWKALFRLPLTLPAWIFAVLALYVAFIALLVMWLGVIVRGRIPRWLFDFEVGVYRFNVRVQSYLSLLTDVYPAWDGAYPMRYEVTYPERVRRRQVVLWKVAASLPQWIVVSLLQYAAYAVVAVGWLVILITGQFPKGLHTFVVGVMRWRERVWAYSISLTDEYPPYSLSAEAPATRGRAYVASSAVGALAIGGLIAAIVALIVTTPFGGEERVVQVSYSRLLAGDIVPGETLVEVNGVEVELVSALDPADGAVALIEPLAGHRLVTFSFRLTSMKTLNDVASIDAGDFILGAVDGDRSPVLAVVGRRAPPVLLYRGDTLAADIVFELPVGTIPESVSYSGDEGWFIDKGTFEFR